MFVIQGLKYRSILDIGHLTLDQPVVCLVGPSGSGKTTLLRHLNRLCEPDVGSILYRGADLRTIEPVELRRRVVMLGQTPVLYSGTIAENLQIGARLARKPLPGREAMARALEQVELSQSLDSFCDKLSGGEKQRLCLARILLMEAETYLLDEPSAALDRESERHVIQNLADSAGKKGQQLILVSHSPQVAGMFPDGVVALEQGRIREVGA
ncbi:MAG: ATP-binding cassette domain-containing protein [Clostridiales bacterium]|nr:ATP-binding cassette domain-containing protein [Clostridiales bacterium]